MSVTMSEKTLSQSSPKTKILVSFPIMLFSIAGYYIGIIPETTKFVALAMGAYFAVGLLELVLGESLISAAKKWDEMAGWKIFLISITVIMVALIGFISLIPVFANV
jgi:hypothetical protein